MTENKPRRPMSMDQKRALVILAFIVVLVAVVVIGRLARPVHRAAGLGRDRPRSRPRRRPRSVHVPEPGLSSRPASTAGGPRRAIAQGGPSPCQTQPTASSSCPIGCSCAPSDPTMATISMPTSRRRRSTASSPASRSTWRWPAGWPSNGRRVQLLALELRVEAQVIGHLSAPRRAGPPAHVGAGFIVDPRFQRRGYASEGSGVARPRLHDARGASRRGPLPPRQRRLTTDAGAYRVRSQGCFRKDVFFRSDAHGRPVWQDTLTLG